MKIIEMFKTKTNSKSNSNSQPIPSSLKNARNTIQNTNQNTSQNTCGLVVSYDEFVKKLKNLTKLKKPDERFKTLVGNKLISALDEINTINANNLLVDDIKVSDLKINNTVMVAYPDYQNLFGIQTLDYKKLNKSVKLCLKEDTCGICDPSQNWKDAFLHVYVHTTKVIPSQSETVNAAIGKAIPPKSKTANAASVKAKPFPPMISVLNRKVSVILNIPVSISIPNSTT
jgi:hypothetical protein